MKAYIFENMGFKKAVLAVSLKDAKNYEFRMPYKCRESLETINKNTLMCSTKAYRDSL